MKSTFLFLLLFSGIVHNSLSQSKLTFGIRTGLQGSWFTDRIGEYGQGGANKYDGSGRLSGSLGTYLNYRLVPALSLQMETYLSGRGGGYSTNDQTIRTVAIGQDSQRTEIYKRYGLNYLEMPFSVRISINDLIKKRDADHGTFFLTLGGGPSFLISSTFIWNTYVSSGYGTNKLDEQRNFDHFPYAKKMVFNGLAGFGYGSGAAYIELRYMQTLGDVYWPRMLDGYNMSTTMGTISFNIGFKLIPWHNE